MCILNHTGSNYRKRVYDGRMRKVLAVLTVVASFAWADQATDRLAIQKVLDQLNSNPANPDLYAKDFDNAKELAALQMDLPNVPADRVFPPNVQVSQRPWGEATVSIPPHP